MENVLPVSTGKKLSVAYTQVLLVLFSLNTSLVYHTPFFIGVFHMKLDKLKKISSKNAYTQNFPDK